jgi:hypothetical protein
MQVKAKVVDRGMGQQVRLQAMCDAATLPAARGKKAIR